MKVGNSFLDVAYDPYDPWMGRIGVTVREMFYEGKLAGKIFAVLIGLADWIMPTTLRRLCRVTPRIYPITVAQHILANDDIENPVVALNTLLGVSVPDKNNYGTAWGLGFPWMSKNGMYSEHIPFVTHTPYAMEALLKLGKFECCREEAEKHFSNTWQFLQSLHILYSGADQLALSYAPLDEPRIVINANAYACYAYCLHGAENIQHTDEAWRKARLLARYVVTQQNEDGSWHYYADRAPGNFIDCFHSCFVIKNLIKASMLDVEIRQLASDAIIRGKKFIDTHFLDTDYYLVKRFTERDIKDPFVWDLYDQAEYLGLLVEFNEFSAADRLCEEVRSRFRNRGQWYCKIDILGRRWGKGFARWGIIPFLYHEAELKKRRTTSR